VQPWTGCIRATPQRSRPAIGDYGVKTYHTVIVGAGTAGCVLAGRLSEDAARTVILLEAGSDYGDLASLPNAAGTSGHDAASAVYLWAYDATLTPERNAPVPQVRGRLVGGSSAVNGGLFLRGIPEDYDAWGSDRWSFRNVLPYFRRTESDQDFTGEFHGTDGPIPIWRYPRERWTPFQNAFYKAAVTLGYAEKPDLNHPSGSGVGPLPMNISGGEKVTTAMGYLHPHRGRANLTIQSESVITRILFDGKRAVGVEGTVAGQAFAVHAEEVILSAGGFGSPHLLLLSGVGPAEDLRRVGIPVVVDLPGVGRNMRCHPSIPVMFSSTEAFQPIPDEPELQTALHYTARGSSKRNDMMLIPSSRESGVLVINCSVRLPVSVGELRIRSADAAVQPSIDYGYLDSWDQARLRDGVRLVLELVAEPALKRAVAARLQPEPDDTQTDLDLDRWILSSLQTPYHACGTCKIGPATDDTAVVDEECRVRGLVGLRVIDLSIVPQSVRSGPHSTVAMVAERAADFFTSPPSASPDAVGIARR